MKKHIIIGVVLACMASTIDAKYKHYLSNNSNNDIQVSVKYYGEMDYGTDFPTKKVNRGKCRTCCPEIFTIKAKEQNKEITSSKCAVGQIKQITINDKYLTTRTKISNVGKGGQVLLIGVQEALENASFTAIGPTKWKYDGISTTVETLPEKVIVRRVGALTPIEGARELRRNQKKADEILHYRTDGAYPDIYSIQYWKANPALQKYHQQ